MGCWQKRRRDAEKAAATATAASAAASCGRIVGVTDRQAAFRPLYSIEINGRWHFSFELIPFLKNSQSSIDVTSANMLSVRELDAFWDLCFRIHWRIVSPVCNFYLLKMNWYAVVPHSHSFWTNCRSDILLPSLPCQHKQAITVIIFSL